MREREKLTYLRGRSCEVAGKKVGETVNGSDHLICTRDRRELIISLTEIEGN